MLIPSIDLRNGKVVQLVQGDRLAIESDDVDGWVSRFEGFPKVQLIDLDAAIGTGENTALVAHICARLPCRVGGGIRSLARAREVLDAGATQAIVGSALFTPDAVNVPFARELAEALGPDRVIGAVDSRAGRVVVKGWRSSVALTAVEAVRALEPYCGEFLYTHVDTEGLLGGIDMGAVLAVARATRRRVTAAGGIRSREEIDALHASGVDAVVGMAIYTGLIDIEGYRTAN